MTQKPGLSRHETTELLVNALINMSITLQAQINISCETRLSIIFHTRQRNFHTRQRNKK
jgi:hypothetical protein